MRQGAGLELVARAPYRDIVGQRGSWLLVNILAVITLLAAACTTGKDTPETKDEAEKNLAFALLADRSLLELSADTGAVLARANLGPRSPLAAGGRFLAPSRSGSTLYALVPPAPHTAQIVAMTDPATLRVRSRLELPRGVAFRALAVGPGTGRLYLFGNRPSGGGSEDAVVAVLDSADGAILSEATIRRAGGHDWWVYDAAVSPSERRLYVSYHGGCGPENFDLCTGGADWIDVNGNNFTRCARQPHPTSGCLGRVHGGVEVLDSRLLATTGGDPILELGRDGRVLGRWKLRLAGNHVMEFAIDRAAGRLYAVGPCFHTGGLSVVELAKGDPRVNADVCGGLVSVGAGRVAIAEQARSDALGVPSRLLLLDPESGRLLRTVNTPLEAVDLLLATRP